MSKICWLSSRDYARETQISVREAQYRCKHGEVECRRRNGQWEIKYYGEVQTPSNIDPLQNVSQKKRQLALERLGLVREYEKHLARIKGQWEKEGRKDHTSYALADFARIQGIGVRTLQRWIRNFREDGIDGLIDRRGEINQQAQITEEAWEFFCNFYLDKKQPSAKLGWQMIRYQSQSENRGWRIPSLRNMYRLIDERIPQGVLIMHREGIAAWEAKCAPYIKNDPESVEPGAIWIGDHHQCNCWVRYRNRWVRPWITTWQDWRSRLQVGWHISAGPNQTTIMRAMKRGLDRYGPPEMAKIDNGRDYDSEMWTGTTKQKRRAIKKGELDEIMIAGLYALMDINVSFAIPYHPQSKPVERFFDTLDRQYCKTLDSYCGKDAARKPAEVETMLKSKTALEEAMSLEEYAERCTEYIETVYNLSAHKGAGMEGRSPADVMNERSSRRVLREGVLDLLLRVWSGELKIGKNGVNFKKLWYGQYNEELLLRFGKTVRAAYDPDDMSRLWIYDAKTLRLITIAEQNRLVAYKDKLAEEHLREGMKAKGRAKRIAKEYVDAAMVAQMDLTELALRAQQADARPKPEPERLVSMRPVATVMDDQVKEHERQESQVILRKAVGAEVTQELQFDLGILNERKRQRAYNRYNDD